MRINDNSASCQMVHMTGLIQWHWWMSRIMATHCIPVFALAHDWQHHELAKFMIQMMYKDIVLFCSLWGCRGNKYPHSHQPAKILPPSDYPSNAPTLNTSINVHPHFCKTAINTINYSNTLPLFYNLQCKQVNGGHQMKGSLSDFFSFHIKW